MKDPYTGEYQKEIITDDGKEYIIRSTYMKDPYTGEYQKEIVEKTPNSSNVPCSAATISLYMGAMVFLFGLLMIFNGGLKYVIMGALFDISSVVCALKLQKTAYIIFFTAVIIAEIIALTSIFLSSF